MKSMHERGQSRETITKTVVSETLSPRERWDTIAVENQDLPIDLKADSPRRRDQSRDGDDPAMTDICQMARRAMDRTIRDQAMEEKSHTVKTAKDTDIPPKPAGTGEEKTETEIGEEPQGPTRLPSKMIPMMIGPSQWAE